MKTSSEKFEIQLTKAILSCPIVYIKHDNYLQVDKVLEDIVDNNKSLKLDKNSVLEYDLGFTGVVSFDRKEVTDETYDRYAGIGGIPLILMKLINPNHPKDNVSKCPSLDEKRIFLFKNLFNKDVISPKILTLLQTFAIKYEQRQYNKLTTIIIVSPEPVDKIPLMIAKYVTVLEVKPPIEDEIKQCVCDIAGKQCFENIKTRKYAEEMVRTLQGLQLYDVKQVLRTTFEICGLNAKAVKLALEEKKRIVRRSGIIEVMDSDESFEEVGGLKRLCEDLEIKSQIYGNLGDANKYNVPIPKGILVVGMPGCGKSMIAKATANKFGVSLLRLDVSRLMGKYVGESEANLRLALSTAEAAHPCVLWIDEIEKAFAGGNNPGGDEDMLVLRMMGHFLTWMQERKSPVYIVATANGVLRPEFMRKGRFDEVYFVDFPTQQEAAEILEKKINKRYLNDKECLFDFSEIKDYTDITKKMEGQFAGSEIECVLNIVVERKFLEYLKEKEVNKDKEDFKPTKIKIKVSDFQSVIEDMKKSIMANQKGKENQKTAIQQIIEMQEIYKFTPASKSSK